ncbi:MAG TPA: DoxX family protein [Terriglobales bacterium]|nr:DoxX family protein [Terriglobales bacterium]
MSSKSVSQEIRAKELRSTPSWNEGVSRSWNIALWILQVLAAVAFFAAGSAKWAGVPAMVETFGKLGLGQWFRYVTGTIEIASAILLLIPRMTFIGASLLVCTMIGALFAHALVLGGNPMPPIMLLLITATIAWKRRAVF